MRERDYEWRGVQRCLKQLHRLMRGEATKRDLMEIIYEDARDYGEDLKDSAAEKKFQRDIAQLRAWFICEAPHENGFYRLNSIGRALIDLPEAALHTLAFLEKTFSGDDRPMGEDVRYLLTKIKEVLPPERRKQIEKQYGILEMELGVKDDDEISEEVWEAIKTSVSEKRQLEFDYHANPDGFSRRHLVEPIRYFFDSVSKHYYLEFFWLSVKSYKGEFPQSTRKVMRWRLGRMSSPKVLPNHFSPNPRIPKKELVYELAPVIARLGVTRHFPDEDMQIFFQDDGSAKVSVSSRDLFFDLRTLLHYGSNCRVIGGEEAVREMKKIVKSLYEGYFSSLESNS